MFCCDKPDIGILSQKAFKVALPFGVTLKVTVIRLFGATLKSKPTNALTFTYKAQAFNVVLVWDDFKCFYQRAFKSIFKDLGSRVRWTWTRL